MIRAIAALALASATAHPSTALVSSSPWWERVTVTVTGDGQPHSCRFESSLKSEAAQSCDVVNDKAAMSSASAGGSSSSSGAKSEYTEITFERRFSPDQPNFDKLQPGDTLIGGQVMALAIDARGAVKTCKVVAATGAMKPQYGCDEVSAEHFEANAAQRTANREGYMAVLVYGHSEHVV